MVYQSGNDRIFGDSGADTIYGDVKHGAEALNPVDGGFSDTIDGGADYDTADGGVSNNTCTDVEIRTSCNS